MFDQFLSKASELLANHESFAIAVVVRYEAPISGKPGNKAIIFADGKIWGWIGGGCAQPVVVKEALKALADGQPRLIRISPSSPPEQGIVDYTMTCHSGGTLDIYIEPVLPKPHILILGRSPVAVALARLSKAINYAVSIAAPQAERERFPDCDHVQADLDLSQIKITPQTFVVVSTQGQHDEEALENALGSEASYVAFVASKVKAAKILDYLKERGLSSTRLGQLKAPAGLDIHASSPEEIAVSILAEIIQENRSGVAKQKREVERAVARQEAKDPICGMMVDIGEARHKSEFRGNAFYFCCAGCKQKFDKQPEQYVP
ncbi:MAG TPA: XdhC family protein [Candidatus Acidoferrum sp.]|nr:XdhC family protein [Candidatus Acidoferrum sp.]